MKKLIFLVGFMGVGKTYLGKKLAQQLHYDFLDTDQLIEKEEGLTIADIFAQQGEPAFRDYENKIIQKLLDRTRLVVSTGGGLPCHHHLMSTLCQYGTTIYLEAPIDIIVKRLLENPEERPLIKALDESGKIDLLNDIMTQRAPCYERADYIFYLSGKKQEDEQDFLSMCQNEF